MYIQKIYMNNYRNYSDQVIHFDKNMNIIYGDNAQGKTNILEAIYLCATSKSHRTNNHSELIKFNKEESHITLELNKDNKIIVIDLHLKKNNKKGIAINKIAIHKLNELFGVINIILFSPEDLSLIKNGPKERRRFIDIELCQLNPLYYHHLKNYYNVLKQRNNLLKQIKFNSSLVDELDIWDLQLIQYGNKIIELREEFIKNMDVLINKNHYKISGGKENIHIFYNKSVEINNFLNKINNNRNIDIKFGSTLIGPHKDDLLFKLGDIDLRKYGSQGQQRTAALSLKLSEIELIQNTCHTQPILLLDDVLSELDHNRQEFLIEYLKDIQTIITCTGIEDFMKSHLNINKKILVENGKVNEN